MYPLRNHKEEQKAPRQGLCTATLQGVLGTLGLLREIASLSWQLALLVAVRARCIRQLRGGDATPSEKRES